MRSMYFRFNAWIKGLVLLMRPHLYLGFTERLNLFFSNTIGLSRWINNQEKAGLNDFYSGHRSGDKREQLYKHVINSQSIQDQPVDYIEFGVFGGQSFFWWMEHNQHSLSTFHGFDTFEGLPEDWGLGFKKGDMSSGVPALNDPRGKFYKGLFQDTVPAFVKQFPASANKKIIHLDADLFSSTLYALTSMAPIIKPGDILLFDEFNVPNHEFFAFKVFSESYYIKTKLIGAVNDYYQVALLITNIPGK